MSGRTHLTARAPIAGAVALALVVAAPAARAFDCYRVGNEALDARRFGDAVRAFEVAADHPDCAASRPGLLRGKAVALEALLDAGGAPVLACRAAETHRAIIGLDPMSRVAAASREALPALERRCAAVPPDPPPPTGDPPPPGEPPGPAPGSHTAEWVVTGSALGALALGGGLLLLAGDAAADRDAAAARILASDPGSADEQAARADFDDAGARTDALGVSGYALAGLGGALAVVAVVLWSVEDTPRPALSIAPTAGGLTLGGVF